MSWSSPVTVRACWIHPVQDLKDRLHKSNGK
jgi:hypothetical protein